MICSRCCSENPEGNRFCEQCGVALEARCAACGRALRPTARFCGACGAAVGGTDAAPVPPGPAPEAALRQTFLVWPRVQAALEEAERLRSA